MEISPIMQVQLNHDSIKIIIIDVLISRDMVHTYATQNCSFLCMYLINLCMYATYSMCVTLLSITCSLITDMILMNYINNFFKAILSLLYFPGYFNYKVHLHTTLQLFMYTHEETGSRLSPNMIIPNYIVNPQIYTNHVIHFCSQSL